MGCVILRHRPLATAGWQAHCNYKRCPKSVALLQRSNPEKPGMCGFKYDDEGTGAIVNSELLSLPGSKMVVASEPPIRLEIQLPRASGGVARMYFCHYCYGQKDLTPRTNATAGCLFGHYPYKGDHLQLAVSQKHECRYFDLQTMKDVCASLSRPGDKPDWRGVTYAEQYFPWWCRGLPAA